MTTTPNSEQFADPDQRYPVASLQPPREVRSLESASQQDNEFESVDDNSPHKRAEKYVQELIDELRVMMTKDAKKMHDYLSDMYASVVAWVAEYRLYDDEMFAVDKDVTGTGYLKEIKLTDCLVTQSRLKFNPDTKDTTTDEEWKRYARSVLGDGHCAFRSLSVYMFDTEKHWQVIRLALMHYAEKQNPNLHMHGSTRSYQDFRNTDANDCDDIRDGVTAKYEGWTFMIQLLAGQDKLHQAGILEVAVATVFFDIDIVLLTQYGHHSSGNYTMVKVNPVAVIKQGTFADNTNDNIPNYDSSCWLVNSPAGAGGYHWDPVIQQFWPILKDSRPAARPSARPSAAEAV